MKKIITTIFLGSITLVNAQVIIGDVVGTASVKTSVLLEFAANQNKGIIVPYVRTMPATPTEGTILLDASTATTARVKYYNANAATGSNGWTDLSGQDANLNDPTVLADFATEQPASITENATSKAIIGSRTTTADGVLVLESATKAMLLPTVTDVQNIPSPSPGMMVYVKGVSPTFNKRLAVFNGAKWSYWKPAP